MNETNLISMKKFFASLILGLSILVLAPFVIMDAYAQSTLYGIASSGGGPGNPSTFYMININNGAGSPVGLVGFDSCDAMEIDQSGKIYIQEAFTIDNVVDTTGCGDSYHGAFLYGILQKWELQKTAEFASAVAAINAMSLGGRSGLPDLRTALEFIDNYKMD